jgi:hypothetical protein
VGLCDKLKSKTEIVVADEDAVDCWMESYKVYVEL